jgi:hypothetical protein
MRAEYSAIPATLADSAVARIVDSAFPRPAILWRASVNVAPEPDEQRRVRAPLPASPASVQWQRARACIPACIDIVPNRDLTGMVRGMEDIRNGVCPLCRHNEIIEGVPLELAGNAGSIPLAVARTPVRFLGLDIGPDNPRGRKGPLGVYTCRQCGFTQWFAYDPSTIPIGSEHGTRLITGPEPEGPYR